MQPRKNARLTAHVVGLGGDGSKGWPSQHTLPLSHLEQVRKIRGSGRELAHLELASGKTFYALSEVALDGLEVELFPLTHTYRLQVVPPSGRRSRSELALFDLGD